MSRVVTSVEECLGAGLSIVEVILIIQGAWQGSFPVRKRTGTLRIWRAREREPIWGFVGGVPSGVQGRAPGEGVRGAKPP